MMNEEEAKLIRRVLTDGMPLDQKRRDMLARVENRLGDFIFNFD